MKTILEVLEKHGYKKQNHGFTKLTESYTHWITIFSVGKVQLYSYFTDDPECEKEYDTGVISIELITLDILLTVFLQNYR